MWAAFAAALTVAGLLSGGAALSVERFLFAITVDVAAIVLAVVLVIRQTRVTLNISTLVALGLLVYVGYHAVADAVVIGEAEVAGFVAVMALVNLGALLVHRAN
jgi:hypothetical protein